MTRFLLLAAVLAAAGCSSQFSPPPMVPAAGKAYYKNKPLVGFGIQLNPTAPGEKKNIANGVTDETGAFKLTTFYPKIGQLQGAAVGRYKAFLVPYPGGTTRVPSEYLDPEKSPWTVEIGQDGNPNMELRIP